MTAITIITTTRKGAHLISNGEFVAWIKPSQMRADGTFTAGAIKALAESTTTVERHEAQQADRAATAVEVSRLTIIRETEKAIAVKVTTSFFNHIAADFETLEGLIWLPKSMIKDGLIAKWFLTKKVDEAAQYIKGGMRFFSLEIAPVKEVAEATEAVAEEIAAEAAPEVENEVIENQNNENNMNDNDKDKKTYRVICETDAYHAGLDPRFPKHSTQYTVEGGLDHEGALRVLEQLADENLSTHSYLNSANPADREVIESGEFLRYSRPGWYDYAGEEDYLKGNEILRHDIYVYSIELEKE